MPASVIVEIERLFGPLSQEMRREAVRLWVTDPYFKKAPVKAQYHAILQSLLARKSGRLTAKATVRLA